MKTCTTGMLGVCFLLLAVSSGAAQVTPSDANLREAVGHYRAAQGWLDSENWERAATEFREAIRLYPLFTDAHYGLGQANMALRRYTTAALAKSPVNTSRTASSPLSELVCVFAQ